MVYFSKGKNGKNIYDLLVLSLSLDIFYKCFYFCFLL